MSDWWQRSAVDLTLALRRKDVSPVELVEAILARLNVVNPRINAVVHLDEKGARQAAVESQERLRTGSPLGPLDGLPLTIKDNLLVKGIPATWGSELFADFVPNADEIPIGRLRRTGAIFLGKTNVPAFTLQGYTSNALFGPTRNPWDPRLTPGGSSGGAVAAIASGLGPLAIGTDGGGSTRRPAGFTGLVGFKPSLGRIARGRGFPAILYDLEVIGLIARTVPDIALLYDALAGMDRRDPRSFLVASLDQPSASDTDRPRRILYVPQFGESPVDAEIAASVQEAAKRLAGLGHIVEQGAVPFDHQSLNETLVILFSAGLASLIGERDCAGRLDPSLSSTLDAGRQITGARYLQAVNAIWQFRSDIAVFFDAYDLILTPASAAQPWPADTPYPTEIEGRLAGPRDHAVFTGFANLAGLPGICLPGPPSRSNLPIGFQLVGRFGFDRELIAMAARYEEAHPWAHRWPPE